MNFDELMQLHEQRHNDRVAIADALGMTPEQIRQMQLEAMRLADELIADTGGLQNIPG
jgi:hypothetical protein